MRSMFLETCKRVSASGNSLTLNLTKELRQLGLDRGDAVKVRLEIPRVEETLETMGGACVIVKDDVLKLRGNYGVCTIPKRLTDWPALAHSLRLCANGDVDTAIEVGCVTVTPVADEFEGVATEVTADGVTFRLTYEEAVWLADRLGGDE